MINDILYCSDCNKVVQDSIDCPKCPICTKDLKSIGWVEYV